MRNRFPTHSSAEERVRALGVTGVLMLAMTLLGCGAPPPETLGVQGGGLSPCPDTPNCVLVRDASSSDIVPRLVEADLPEVWSRVVGVIDDQPRVELVAVTDRYIHATERSRVFRFIDDLELLWAADDRLIVRSASRLGRGDMGVNRRRVLRVLAALESAGLVRPSP